MDTTAFALYSFAVSMENIINTFMTPITVTLYNYFCKDINIQNTKKLKNLVLIWGFIIIGAAFPLKWILENFLHKYIGAISVMFFLFAAQAFLVVIRGIYVNIYKAELKQSRYFKQMLIMITVGTILNGVLYTVFKSMWSIAVATLITSIIWLVICECESKDIRFNSSEYFAIILLLGSYLICGHKLSAIIGMIIYYASGVVIILLLMRQSTKQIVDIVWIYFKKVYNKLMLINSNHLSK
ncbi:hypothetical protein N3C_1473 [Clostridium sp. N3C]|uniref:hypothetical protein n=1 Tax=Clostridium sp. N3C TaxID=1776758 RepID=UPI00092E17F1|nr:hypothetical protein [Clostridium sp. N3C]SCN23745.1 hypothetical protein N3C_1473 [Clostridium sp. N3C]